MSFKEYNQDQPFLLPPSLHDFLPGGHLAHVVNEVVDELNLDELYARYSDIGCTAYHPRMMLKVVFYGYSTGERSSRVLAHRLTSDVAYMYLSGVQQPDFRTISRFRKDNLEWLKGLFIQIVRLCRELGMVSIGRIAIDGTKIKANASYKKTKGASELDEWIEDIDQQIAEILKGCEEVDRREDEEMGEDKSVYEVEEELREKRELRERLKRAKEKVEERKGKKINLTDEEAETMLHKGYRPEPSYNGQIAVEGSIGVIVGARLTTNPADYEGLKELIEEVEASTGEKPKEVLADSGFSCFDNLGYLEEEEIVGYIPDQEMESIRKGTRAHPEFHKSRFKYNEADDSFRCPMGKSLSYKGMIRRKGRHEVRVYQGRECPGCERKRECTKSTYRTISKDTREILMERMQARLDTKEGKRIYGKRKYMIEPVFGDMKYNRNFGELLLRGKVKARGEFMLMCIAHNLRKIAKHLTRRDGFLPPLSSYVSKIRHLWSCVFTATEVMAV